MIDAPARSAGRIRTLDLIRGVAILGILTVNMAGFAGPMAATLTPDWNGPASAGDHLAFLATFVLFEGKMRGLLSLLFGASMMLFLESAEARGRSGDGLQLRRLIWLGVIGYLHFLLLWWGDILFTYALAGFFALLLRHLPVKAMVPAALLAFGAWHGSGMASSIAPILAEARFEARVSPPAEAKALAELKARKEAMNRAELAREQGAYLPLLAHKAGPDAALPMIAALLSLGEVLPMMLIGMALYRSGFFTGGWPVRMLRRVAVAGIGCGAIVTLGLAIMASRADFAAITMEAVLAYWAAVPHLLMTLGYAALLVLLGERHGEGRFGRRIVAVGQLALSNYLACSLAFTAIFYGWGLGLIGTVPQRWHWAFVLGGWIAMLWWSKPWLARFGQGPAERLWRRLAS
ncbi:DUF418 domain-containing protein [Novosphingobium sp. TH158]|uniref:DUF418 domain-containing protein n=1 Tax=Novosphingobium sp. TH158 TaxID=2067455 RepID=UPI000C7C3CDC|nr:DUF418 domain-containing protein [Novosphingobium sp. TH158]PLK24326.1 hypothetical protein C0V78_13760 [Novosphingobium sp. TH158]